jgi:hypothetical protein
MNNNNNMNNSYPNLNQDVPYCSNMINVNNGLTVDLNNPMNAQPKTALPGKKWVGIPGCTKCGGSGYKKKDDKEGKPCKLCVKATGVCPLCNNTGVRSDKAGKPCKCKDDKKDKKDKKDKDGKDKKDKDGKDKKDKDGKDKKDKDGKDKKDKKDKDEKKDKKEKKDK